MKKPFYYLWGDLSKDLRLRAVPNIFREARERSDENKNRPLSDETVLARDEFEKRYKHLRASCMALLVLAVFSLIMMMRSSLFISSLGALLAAAIMLMVAFMYAFRLSVARHVYRSGKTRLVGVVTIRQYLCLCLKKPKELLPLPLPRARGKSRPITEHTPERGK